MLVKNIKVSLFSILSIWILLKF